MRATFTTVQKTEAHTASMEAEDTEDDDDGVPEWVKGVRVFETAYWLMTGREKDVPKRTIAQGSSGGFDFMSWFSSASSSGSGTSKKKKPDADKEAAKRSGGW